MGFKKKDVDKLLVATGRRCCICGNLHKVQVHHIIKKEDGGTDDIDNAISLCPNCHDEVHAQYARGRVSRIYTHDELVLHRERTIDQVSREGKWTPGSEDWEKDKELIQFFAQCLDRPAFRTHFHQEMSFADFDKAIEDTLITLNTGYWRMRDGTLIERGRGKSCIINPQWRQKLDQISQIIESIRSRFQQAFGLQEMLYHYGPMSHHLRDFDDLMEGLRHDRSLGNWMDEQRQSAITLMNYLLDEIGLQPLRGIDEW